MQFLVYLDDYVTIGADCDELGAQIEEYILSGFIKNAYSSLLHLYLNVYWVFRAFFFCSSHKVCKLNQNTSQSPEQSTAYIHLWYGETKTSSKWIISICCSSAEENKQSSTHRLLLCRIYHILSSSLTKWHVSFWSSRTQTINTRTAYEAEFQILKMPRTPTWGGMYFAATCLQTA